MSKLTELEQVIGYEFNEQRLLQQALTHSSTRSIQISRRAI